MMNRALDALRRLVYRLGFRPKPGAILYSPSRALQLFWIEAMKREDDE